MVVRVNDRGPFVHNRIIDLSYAAADKLDMIRDGTALVEVTAISFDKPSGNRTVSTRQPATPPASTPPPSEPPVAAAENRIFVQVGAFGDKQNADRRVALLARAGIENVIVHEERVAPTTLYKIRIGPVNAVDDYDALVQKLANAGISDPYLISE